ncbi:MAG: uroporphyrinogen decarboxylase family protein [Thermodesulfobacteriota bacterium]|nr:uroporphyrinogen decarboxylase family protein [Thermodesulfobacteriota bacterium]
MSKYTGKQHVAAAFKREFTDRVPYYPILGHFNAKLASFSIKEFLTDSEKFAQAQLLAHETFHPDIIVMMADLLIEVEALGNELKFPDDSPCISKTHVLKDKENFKNFKIPNPEKDGRMPYYIDACKRVKENVKDSAVGSVVCGPWAIAIGLREAEVLIRDCSKDPNFVHSLMEFTLEVASKYALAVQSNAGVGVSFSEAPASCSLISPKIYRQFVFPYHKRLMEKMHSKKIGVTLHVCGYVDPIMEDLINTGADALSIDAKSSLARMVELNRKKAVIIGNVNTNLFFSGTKGEMEQAVQACIDMAAKESAFILSTGCEVPWAGSVERVRWFMDATEKYGYYLS